MKHKVGWGRSLVVLVWLWGVQGLAHSQELLVSAAASLADALSAIKPRFEAAHAGTTVHFNFGASGALSRQIEAGAPVDLFVSAARAQMDRLQQRQLIVPGTRVDLLSNELVLIAPANAPPGLAGFSDLPRASRIALGDPGFVPAGEYAQQTLTALKLWTTLQPRLIYGQDVRQVLEYVARGEVDAGLVFATDAALLPQQVKILARAPQGSHVPIVYPAAQIAGAAHPELAAAFLHMLGQPDSCHLFHHYGFSCLPK